MDDCITVSICNGDNLLNSINMLKFTRYQISNMIDVKDLRVCSDCGTTYHEKFSRGVCPNCHTNNYEQVSADSGVGNSDR